MLELFQLKFQRRTMGSGSMFGSGDWPWRATDSALYLANYSMEAVSFTEFLFSEAVQHGIMLLKIIKKNKDYEELEYFSNLFYAHVWYPAISFHYAYGPMSPFTNQAFTLLYKHYWRLYQSIIKIDDKWFTGYSEKEGVFLNRVMEIMADRIDDLDPKKK